VFHRQAHLFVAFLIAYQIMVAKYLYQ